MPLNEDIGYVNADNNNELEPKVTPAGSEKTQTPDNYTSGDANAIIDFIKEDRFQINKNEQSIIDINDQIYVYNNYGLTVNEDATESGAIVLKNESNDDVDLTLGQTDLFVNKQNQIIPNENLTILAGQIKALDVQGAVTVKTGDIVYLRTNNSNGANTLLLAEGEITDFTTKQTLIETVPGKTIIVHRIIHSIVSFDVLPDDDSAIGYDNSNAQMTYIELVSTGTGNAYNISINQGANISFSDPVVYRAYQFGVLPSVGSGVVKYQIFYSII